MDVRSPLPCIPPSFYSLPRHPLRKPNKFYAKWLFLFVRYFAVSMQMSVLLFSWRLLPFVLISSHLSALLFVGTRLSISFNYKYSDCVKWYIFQEVGTQVLIATVESILIVRGASCCSPSVSQLLIVK